MGGGLRLGDASKVVHCSAKIAFKSSDFSRGEEVGVPFLTRVGMLRKDLIPHTDFAVFHQRCVSLTASFEESLEHRLAKNLRSAKRSSATYKFRTLRYAIDSLCSLSRDFDLWKRRSRCRLKRERSEVYHGLWFSRRTRVGKEKVSRAEETTVSQAVTAR